MAKQVEQDKRWERQEAATKKQEGATQLILDQLRAMREGQDFLKSQVESLTGQVRYLTNKVELLSTPVSAGQGLRENNDRLIDAVYNNDVSAAVFLDQTAAGPSSGEPVSLLATAPPVSAGPLYNYDESAPAYLEAFLPPSYDKVIGVTSQIQDGSAANSISGNSADTLETNFSSSLERNELAAPYLAALNSPPRYQFPVSKKYKVQMLFEENVILEIDQAYPSVVSLIGDTDPHSGLFTALTLEFTTVVDKVGEFEVSSKLLGNDIGQVKLVFEDLLQYNHNGISILQTCGVVFNVTPLISFINKKFYR